MTVAHYLRGYHWDSGELGVDIHLDGEMWPAIKAALPTMAHDHDLIDPVALTHWQTVRLADATGLPVDPAGFDYFIEADEHWRVVAEVRDALLAQAA